MFDMEVLRNRQMIEEREEYENSFISIEEIIKSDEMDFQIAEYMDFEEKFESEEYCMDFDFDFEDYMDKLRDEQLIEERLAYEMSAYLEVEDYYADYDPLDAQIEAFEYYEELGYDYVPEYEHYDYELEEDFVEEINMDAAYCGNALFGYVVEDDSFDGFCDYDYPEGPYENLDGIVYHEMVYYDCPFPGFPDEDYDCPEQYYNIEDSDVTDTEDMHMKKLINEHIKEEKEFLEFVKENELKDDYYLPAGNEDIIFFKRQL